jgi:hypothetical protein
MNLAEQIRQARKLEIKVGDCVFYARRPTYEDIGGISIEGTRDPEIVRRFVTGWKNVRSKDLFVDGTDELIEFDREVWNEAIGDLPDIWRAIADTLIQEAQAHQEKREAARKNSRAG